MLTATGSGSASSPVFSGSLTADLAQFTVAGAGSFTASGGGGSLTHGSSFTVTGSGFGTKSGSTPKLWDYGQDADNTVNSGWSGAYPSTASNAYANLKNRSLPFTNTMTGSTITGPHSNISRVLAGCHLDVNTSSGGNNVLPFVNFTRPSFPYYSYWCWYVKNDPTWAYGGDPLPNYKTYAFGAGGGDPYVFPNWYLCGFGGNLGNSDWALNDDAGLEGSGSLIKPDNNGHSNYWDSMVSPWVGWVKREVLVKWSNTTAGFIKAWDNNVLKLDYAGPTDKYAGTSRSEGIEGYNRERGGLRWRYIAGVYYDRQSSPGRFVFTNNSVYASSTIVEPQSYTSWSDASVTLTCNKGALSSGHLHYRDEVNGHQYKGLYTLN